MTMLKNLALLAVCLGGLFLLSQFALLFAIVTVVTAFLVFSKIEADQNVYDLGFWFTRYPSAGLLAWFRAFGKLEAVVRSLLLGLLAWFTFAGDDTSRTLDAAWRLCWAVFGSYWLLFFLSKKAHLNVLRWAFVKLSIFLGVVFSFISVMARTVRTSFVDSLIDLWPFGKEPTTDAKVEKVHRAIGAGTEIVQQKLGEIIGEFWATVVLIVFNTQVLHGFLVVLFTFAILLLTVPSLGRRPESFVPAEEAGPSSDDSAQDGPGQ